MTSAQMPGTTVLDVVIPVYNEQAVVEASVRRLHEHLVATFPYPFRITVADNASTDNTWQVAQRLTRELPGVAAVHLDAKGRGRALKQVWLASDALVYAYMDVDLSTDLDALWPLVAPLMSGHSDLAIGSRLDPNSRVVRGAKREFISRSYNLILRATLGARFTDAQCGFKAIRADVAQELLPLVQDTAWFFDTELLVLAERTGLRIHEVPVDWYDDPDSRVDVVSTATDDLKGVLRVRRSMARQRHTLDDLEERLGRHPIEMSTSGQISVFAIIGALSTVLHLGGFVALSQLMSSAQLANAIALITAAMVNTAANRRWTFRVRGRADAAKHQAQGLLILALTLVMNSAGLDLLHLIEPQAATWLQTLTVAATTLLATAVKFLAMRLWIFAPRTNRRRRAAAVKAAPQGADYRVTR